ncbi:MAG TPA: hypothetical protein VNC16_07135 [Solirubrobacterales bacterium]|jgi:hypothetical protein|nr:hypothetical protein [Solirubrobacterales bacterium]
MISRIHNKLGTAGLVVAIVALVAALTGAAYAAQGLNGKQKKEVKKIAKKFAGKQGPQGPAGPAGPQGPAGKDGANGTNGTNGQSVTGTPIASGGVCGAATGVKYTLNGTPTTVCSGEDGETGFTATLPPGETETGAWAVGAFDSSSQLVSLSFNIPLAEAPEAMHYVNAAGEERTAEGEPFHDPTNCLGSPDEPTAPAGDICVYADNELIEAEGGFPGTAFFENLYPTGATFLYFVEGGEAKAWGTWAVTAATTP